MSTCQDISVDQCFSRLQANGIFHVENYFSKQDVLELRKIIDSIVSNNSEFSDRHSNMLGNKAEEANNKIYEINRACGLDKNLKETNVYAGAKLLAEELLRSKVFYSFDHIIYKSAHSGSVKWHQDQAYKSRVKKMKSVHLWIPLHDISPDGGGMQYVSGSNKGPLYAHHKLEGSHTRFVDDDIIDLSKVVKCNTKIGGVVAHLPDTLHSSLPNITDEVRRAWTIHFSPYGQLEPLLPINLIHYSKFLMQSWLQR
jgi:hypothetical protein